MDSRELSAFENLPTEILRILTEHYLNRIDNNHFSLISRRCNSIFQQVRLGNKFLKLVADGEEIRAKEMLQQFPHLITFHGRVMDLGGREYFHTSAFQLALHQLDVNMWQMLFDSVRNFKKPFKYLTELNYQFQQLTSEGLKYSFHDAIYQDKHYDLSPLVNILKSKAIISGIKLGKIQASLPVNIAQRYCDSSVAFRDLPKRGLSQFNRKLIFVHIKRFNNYVHWYNQNNTSNFIIGKDCGVVRGSHGVIISESPRRTTFVLCDCFKVKSINQTRIKTDAAAIKYLQEEGLRQYKLIGNILQTELNKCKPNKGLKK